MPYHLHINSIGREKRDAFIRAQYLRHYGIEPRLCTLPPCGKVFALTVTDKARDIVAAANVHVGRLPFQAQAMALEVWPEAPPELLQAESPCEVTRLTCADVEAMPVLLRGILGVGLAAGARSVVSLARTGAHARLYRRAGLRAIGAAVPQTDGEWHFLGHPYTLVACRLLDTLRDASEGVLSGAGV